MILRGWRIRQFSESVKTPQAFHNMTICTSVMTASQPLTSFQVQKKPTRVWLHGGKSKARKILTFLQTPTHITSAWQHHQWISLPEKWWFRLITTKPLRLLSLHGLADAVSWNPNMFDIPHEKSLATLQSLYVLTGCEFTSFFAQISKSFFATTFFRFAAFICALNICQEVLLKEQHKNQASWHSWSQLVWCIFWKLTSFRNQFESPIDCYQSYTTQSEVPSQQHFTWIKTLNAKIWERVDLEDSLIPSIEALWLHWMRSRWVLLSGDKHNVPIFNCHQRSEISNVAKFEFWSKQYKDCFLLSIITCTVYTHIIYVDMFINICFVHLVVWL